MDDQSEYQALVKTFRESHSMCQKIIMLKNPITRLKIRPKFLSEKIDRTPNLIKQILMNCH